MWRVFLAVVGSCFAAQAASGQDASKRPDPTGIARTIRSCIQSKWSEPAANYTVKVRLQLDRAGRLTAPIEIMNPSQEALARKAEQSAIRAIKACEPYELPPEHYSAWKVLILTLEPRPAAVADTKQVCSGLEDPEERLKSCARVIRGDPRAAWAYNERAWAYFKMGNAAQGLPDVEKSLELDPNLARALDTRAHIFEALGRREEAVADFRRALSVAEADTALKISSRAGLKRLGIPLPPDASVDGVADPSRQADITQSPENEEFGRNVKLALRGTMPKVYRNARVTVRLLLDEKGKLQEVRVVKNEGDAEMPRMVLDAVRRTTFPIPPKGATVGDRTFTVNYVYH
jgi:TonB family protein